MNGRYGHPTGWRWGSNGLALGLFAALLCGPIAGVARGVTADGFTEPYRTIDVAAAETGIIASLAVHEGDSVHQGDVLATLDDEVHTALLAIADQAMQSAGALDAALAEQQLRQDRLAKLRTLRGKGHARQEEVERAKADLAIAEAQIRSAREERAIKKLEYQKIKAQLQRRTIRAPSDGVVTTIVKEVGEYVAANDANVLTIVQLDPLLATFSLPSQQAASLQVEQNVTVRSLDMAAMGAKGPVLMNGVVDFISPVTDAESGTVRVKVRIANHGGRFRSGERCSLEVPRSALSRSSAR
jgi:RND family efflux transporter MFP subunit